MAVYHGHYSGARVAIGPADGAGRDVTSGETWSCLVSPPSKTDLATCAVYRRNIGYPANACWHRYNGEKATLHMMGPGPAICP